MAKFEQLLQEDKQTQQKKVSVNLNERFARAEEAFSTHKGRKERIHKALITLPTSDYKLIDEMKIRAAGMRFLLNKSEVVRAGLRALKNLSDQEFKNVVDNIDNLQNSVD